VLVAELATAEDGRGLALVVDDGHWADAASLRLIAHLLLLAFRTAISQTGRLRA